MSEEAAMYSRCHLRALYGQIPACSLNYFYRLGHIDIDSCPWRRADAAPPSAYCVWKSQNGCLGPADRAGQPNHPSLA
ncbi:hypothetical protein MHYP_G00038040 [Metynnis hypsauchen]